jgi:imidazolonepropionase
MSSKLIRNIGQLITNSERDLGIINDAALVIEEHKVVWVGANSAAPDADESIDALGGTVTPGFVDSHTHAVFAGDRSKDYVARMTGSKYATGGIKTTVAATRSASEAELIKNTQSVLRKCQSQGTTTVEIKSGYGLNVESEVKILKVAQEFTDETTYLGAHVIPIEFESNRNGYVKLVKGEMLQAALPYCKWIDVFCDNGAFTVEESREILQAGIKAGLLGRIHGNQLGQTGGAELAIELGLASVDHATHVSDKTIEALAASEVVTTFLPGAEFFTKSTYPNVKRYFELGAEVALATDCNPGSSYLTSMPIVMSLAVREMGFTPAQALYAATAGGAAALKRSEIGHLQVGAQADLVIWQAPTYEHIAYRMGEIGCKVLAVRKF